MVLCCTEPKATLDDSNLVLLDPAAFPFPFSFALALVKFPETGDVAVDIARSRKYEYGSRTHVRG